MRVYLFDIDGTLIFSGGAGGAAVKQALKDEFGLTEIKDGVPMSGRTDRVILRELFQLNAVEDTPDNWQRFLAGYLRALPRQLAQRGGSVLPGVTTLLDALAGMPETTVGLLTGNVREGARLKLSHFGLFQHFSFGGFGDEHFDRDDVARMALAETHRRHGQLDSEKVWVVGDTPLDVGCARAIGVRVCAVATGTHSREELEAAKPDLLLGDLSDPEPLLDA